MVGVPGRSKGCATCRTRHVRCDETRPSCNRCKKAGYECQGYNRVTVFVDETDWVQSKHGIDRLISDIASDNSSPRTASSTANPAKGQNLTDISLNRSLQQLASALSNNPNQDITRDVLGFIEGVILEGALSSNFWSYTPSSDVAETDNRPGSKSEQQNLTGGLVSSRRGGGSITKRLFLPRMIVHAIALTLYGGKSGDALSVTQAAQLYGYAVRQVGSDLRKPNLSSNQTILLSILNLGLYDWIASTDMSAWRHHMRALGYLTEMKGPSAWVHDIDVKTFMRARAMLIIFCLEEARKCFLEQDYWMTLPWLERRLERSHMHMFVDVFCCLPGMLQDVNLFKKLPDEAPEKANIRNNLQIRIPEISRFLFETRWKWEVSNSGCCVELHPKELLQEPISTDENGTPLFGTSYFFNDMARAVEMNIYSISYMLLFGFATVVGCVDKMMATNPMDLRNSDSLAATGMDVTSAADSHPEPETTKPAIPIISHSIQDPQIPLLNATFSPSSPSKIQTAQLSVPTAIVQPLSRPKTNPCLPWPHELHNPHAIAHDICRSVDYFFMPHHRTAGAYFAIVPMRTLQYIFEKKHWESEWVRKTMELIVTQGFQGVEEFCQK